MDMYTIDSVFVHRSFVVPASAPGITGLLTFQFLSPAKRAALRGQFMIKSLLKAPAAKG